MTKAKLKNTQADRILLQREKVRRALEGNPEALALMRSAGSSIAQAYGLINGDIGPDWPIYSTDRQNAIFEITALATREAERIADVPAPKDYAAIHERQREQMAALFAQDIGFLEMMRSTARDISEAIKEFAPDFAKAGFTMESGSDWRDALNAAVNYIWEAALFFLTSEKHTRQ